MLLLRRPAPEALQSTMFLMTSQRCANSAPGKVATSVDVLSCNPHSPGEACKLTETVSANWLQRMGLTGLREEHLSG